MSIQPSEHNPQENEIRIPVKEAGLVVALLGFILSLGAVTYPIVTVFPRVTALEKINENQDNQLFAIRESNAQRSEALASLKSTVDSIDRRTQRIESQLTPSHP